MLAAVPPADHVLAIDLGTSGPKVGLVGPDGALAGVGFEPVPLRIIPGGGAEQDPEQWWRAIVAATGQALASSGLAPDRVMAVGVTSQWSGTVAVDEQGDPLAPAVSWMDTRGAEPLQRRVGGAVRVVGYGPVKLWRWLRLTGGAPGLSGRDPLAHILWLQEAHPAVAAAARAFLEPKDWVNLRLTGRLAAGYDSIALHWVTDNRRPDDVRYHDGLLAQAGLSRDKLPDLRPATDVLGPLTDRAAADLGLPAGVPVSMGTPDVHAAALGSGGAANYEPHIYLGTSSWFVAHVPFKKTDIAHSMASMPAALPGRYILLNEQGTAGKCLSFLRDALLFPDDALTPGGAPAGAFATLDALAAQAPAGSRGLLFLPWLYGERTPIEDPDVRGGWVNLSLDVGRPELVRSVLEGVALNSRWLLAHVERFMGQPVREVRLVGGGASSDVWCQIYADVLGRPILQIEDPVHAGLLGVAGLARVAVGAMGPDDIGAWIRVRRRYEPNSAHGATYAASFRELVATYRRNHKPWARLRHAVRPT